jgi:hypothetical protein
MNEFFNRRSETDNGEGLVIDRAGTTPLSRDMEFDREIPTLGLIEHLFNIFLSAISDVQVHYSLRAELIG